MQYYLIVDRGRKFSKIDSTPNSLGNDVKLSILTTFIIRPTGMPPNGDLSSSQSLKKLPLICG
jgi:hypothetical protein